MSISDAVSKTQRLAKENSTVILTAVGVTGTVTTAFLTGRASFKAAEIIRQEEQRELVRTDGHGALSARDKASLVWTEYVPAVGVGTVTVGSIVMANRLGTKKAAALAAAYGISERAFTEYKEKVVEKLGEGKERSVRDELAQDRVTKNPVVAKEVIIAGSGAVLCMDAMTGRYFMSSIEEIKKAENTINYELIHHMYASLSSFYNEVGLPPTSYSEEVGWNTNNPLQLTFSTAMSSDDRPCVVIDFATAPVAEYTRLY